MLLFYLDVRAPMIAATCYARVRISEQIPCFNIYYMVSPVKAMLE
jgi:hypothetical protein